MEETNKMCPLIYSRLFSKVSQWASWHHVASRLGSFLGGRKHCHANVNQSFSLLSLVWLDYPPALRTDLWTSGISSLRPPGDLSLSLAAGFNMLSGFTLWISRLPGRCQTLVSPLGCSVSHCVFYHTLIHRKQHKQGHDLQTYDLFSDAAERLPSLYSLCITRDILGLDMFNLSIISAILIHNKYKWRRKLSITFELQGLKIALRK